MPDSTKSRVMDMAAGLTARAIRGMEIDHGREASESRRTHVNGADGKLYLVEVTVKVVGALGPNQC